MKKVNTAVPNDIEGISSTKLKVIIKITNFIEPKEIEVTKT